MLARVAYEFRPPEYFALALFGLSMLASISAGGTVRNLMGGVFGVWLATIGAEPTTGIERFMFGNYELYEGLSFVPVFIGLFAMSELLVQSSRVNRLVDKISYEGGQIALARRLQTDLEDCASLLRDRYVHRNSSGRRGNCGLNDWLR